MPESIQPATGGPQRIENERPRVKVGDWYWADIEGRDHNYKELPSRKRLVCVIQVGSNFVKLSRPGGYQWRHALAKFPGDLVYEPNPAKFLREEVDEAQANVLGVTKKIEALCLRLGLTPREALPEKAASDIGTAIVKATGKDDVKAYKRALVRAKEKQLPELFKELQHHNETLATAMKAELLPLNGYAKALEGRMGLIEDRIFHVELYGGLCEKVEQVSEGEPAGMGERLRVLQRRLYMDEECLLDYDAGGMDFTSVRRFDKWMARPHNRDRLLPFPRCVAAFRIRRNRKSYGPLDSFIRFSWDDANNHTYLYLRNGDNLYRLSTDLDFGSRLFPGKAEFDFTQPVYAKMFCESIDRIYTEGEVVQMRERRAEARKRLDAWRAAHPKKDPRFDAPWEERKEWERLLWYDDDPDRLRRFSPDDVYYDDIKRHFDGQIKAYNRITVVLQGLLDRSPVFHPHPPVKLWKDRDFEFIELVYDDDRALYAGPKPDFAAYQARLNASIAVGTMVVGQRAYWNVATTHPDKRPAGQDDIPHLRANYRDNGPAKVAGVARRHRASCDFVWERERAWSRYYRDNEGPVKSWLKRVPLPWLLNVDAYTPGDHRQFFADPRTREEYLQWAGLMLEAERYKAGGKEEED